MPRPLPLVYVGNQYDRDEAFAGFFAPAAARHPHRVAGKWTRTRPVAARHLHRPDAHSPTWAELYESALATILLLPERYARAGQMTQRIFEAVLAGCLPLTPAALPFAAAFTPPALHVATGDQAADVIGELQVIAGTAEHAALIGECIAAARDLPAVPAARRHRNHPAEARRCRVPRVLPRPSREPLVSGPMERIAIIGCGGSGKSHLARALGARLGITPVHLDAVYYDKDWKPLDQETFAALQRDLVAAPRWIIDGNYASTLPIRLEAADTVIFLDLPGWACLWGILQRGSATAAGSTRPSASTTGSPGTSSATSSATARQMAPRVRALIADHAGDAQVIVLRSRAAVRRYLADRRPPRPPSDRAAASHEDRR